MNKLDATRFDPGVRSTAELLWGPEPSEPGEIRGNTVRGRARYSRDEAIRAATCDLLPRLADELRVIADGRPLCGYAHAATSPTCKDKSCQTWIDQIVAWHTERFGARYLDVTLGAVLWMSSGRSLELQVSSDRLRDSSDPATVALDIKLNGSWVTVNVGLRADASKADFHDLVDRLWAEVLRVRALAGVDVHPTRSSPRAGRLDRPARATYWRLRQFQGLTLGAIAAEWERLTRSWAEGATVPQRRLEFPAWAEWRRAGSAAGVESFEELGTLQRAIAKLRRLTT